MAVVMVVVVVAHTEEEEEEEEADLSPATLKTTRWRPHPSSPKLDSTTLCKEEDSAKKRVRHLLERTSSNLHGKRPCVCRLRAFFLSPSLSLTDVSVDA